MDTKPKSPIALPFRSTSFFGRSAEIADITALLNSPTCRLLTLTGMGGTGKTLLAIEAARRTGDQFPDGIYFVALQPLQTADQIISAVIKVLNLQIVRDPQAELLDWLRQKRLLLVMDNFEHLLDGAPLLTGMLEAAPQLKILTTSRDPLRLKAEWLRHIDGLNYPATVDEQVVHDYDAVALFVERARQKRGDLNPAKNYAHIVRICHLVEGMPLALELAAGWVESLSCAAIADELEHSQMLLAARIQDVPSRHQSMQMVFDQTWRRLTESEQRVLRCFTVFRGGCTREAARQITGANLPLLAGLVEKSLLRHNPVTDRYGMHELLRQYGGEQLAASGETEAAREAHTAYFVDFLRDQWQVLRGSQQVRAIEAIEAEFDNIRSMWQDLIEKRDAARLSVCVHPLSYYADLRARYQNALPLFRQAQAALQPFKGENAAVDRAIGQMLIEQGLFCLPMGDYEQGRRACEQGLAILQNVGTPEDQTLALGILCMLCDRLDDYPGMQWCAAQAEQIACQSGDRWQMARAIFLKACVRMSGHQDDTGTENFDLTDLEQTRHLVEDALREIEVSGDLWLRGVFYVSAAWLAVLMGDYPEALRRCRHAIGICEEVGQIVIIAQAQHNLGLILRDMNDQAGANFHFLQALKVLSEQGGYAGDLIGILVSVAQLRSEQGDLLRAAELAAMILHHPASYLPAYRRASDLLRELEAAMTPVEFAAAQARGRQLDLQDTIHDLLHEQPAAKPDDHTGQAAQVLAEPLTAREQEVLKLLAEGLSNAQIAERLVVTTGTVKWYLNHMYQKMEVTGRAQAVIRARQLHLI